MSWFLLLIAGLFEVGWAIGLKHTEGFTKPLASVLTLSAMAASVVLLGIAILGIILFGEAANPGRIASLNRPGIRGGHLV